MQLPAGAALALTPTPAVFSWGHSGRATKCSCETRLRGKASIEGNLCKRQSARCHLGHRVLQPHAADITLGRDAGSEREHAPEMEPTDARDRGEVCERDLISEMCRNVIKDT